MGSWRHGEIKAKTLSTHWSTFFTANTYPHISSKQGKARGHPVSAFKCTFLSGTVPNTMFGPGPGPEPDRMFNSNDSKSSNDHTQASHKHFRLDTETRRVLTSDAKMNATTYLRSVNSTLTRLRS